MTVCSSPFRDRRWASFIAILQAESSIGLAKTWGLWTSYCPRLWLIAFRYVVRLYKWQNNYRGLNIKHNSLRTLFQIILNLLGVVLVILMTDITLMIPIAAAMVIFYIFRVIYIRTTGAVKRLEGISKLSFWVIKLSCRSMKNYSLHYLVSIITNFLAASQQPKRKIYMKNTCTIPVFFSSPARSPVFGHVNATILGLATIRSFGAEFLLAEEFDRHQDLHSAAWYLFITCSRAFGYFLDLICLLFIICVTFSCLMKTG